MCKCENVRMPLAALTKQGKSLNAALPTFYPRLPNTQLRLFLCSRVFLYFV